MSRAPSRQELGLTTEQVAQILRRSGLPAADARVAELRDHLARTVPLLIDGMREPKVEAMKAEREAWSRFLRDLERTTDGLTRLLGNCDQSYWDRIEEFGAALDPELYPWRPGQWFLDTSNLKSQNPSPFSLEDMICEIATLAAVARVAKSEITMGQPGAPDLKPLQVFVIGLAMLFERLAGQRFTFLRHRIAGKPAAITPGHTFVAEVVRAIDNQLPRQLSDRSVSVACERTVTYLRKLQRHRARPRKSTSGRR